MTIIEMNMTKTLFLAVVLLLFGKFIRSRVKFLRTYCIPDAVVGGLIFAVLALVLRQFEIIGFEFDATLQSFFMNIFFTASGFQASRGLIKKGGKKVVIFIGLAALLALFQNVVAVGLSNILDIDPLIGLMTGSIPMTGGHGNAASFAPLAEDAGAVGALSVAVAAATFGLVAGSIIGGPIGNWLIKKNNLAVEGEGAKEIELEMLNQEGPREYLDGDKSAKAAFQILIALGLGAYLADLFDIIMPNVTLPIHVMGMIAGAILRNVIEIIHKDDPNDPKSVPLAQIDIIGDISLGIFVSMAIMTMKLWELTGLAGPLLILLFAQVVLIVLFTVIITYNLMGRDYDAAVMTAGHIGFGMGAVPVSMANMNAVCSKYKYSQIAFFIVPIVGGMFSNFTNAAIITAFLNYLG